MKTNWKVNSNEDDQLTINPKALDAFVALARWARKQELELCPSPMKKSD
jgi:hypothetical protein